MTLLQQIISRICLITLLFIYEVSAAETVYATDGQSVVLPCRTRNHHGVNTYVWNVPTNRSQSLTSPDGDLLVPRVSVSDTGLFTCKVYSNGKFAEEVDLELQVWRQPQLWHTDLATYTVLRDQCKPGQQQGLIDAVNKVMCPAKQCSLKVEARCMESFNNKEAGVYITENFPPIPQHEEARNCGPTCLLQHRVNHQAKEYCTATAKLQKLHNKMLKEKESGLGSHYAPLSFPSSCALWSSLQPHISCEPGFYLKGARCLPCVPGSFSGSAAQRCTPCAPGSYQAAWGRSGCELCPSGQGSAGEGHQGATSKAACGGESEEVKDENEESVHEDVTQHEYYDDYEEDDYYDSMEEHRFDEQDGPQAHALRMNLQSPDTGNSSNWNISDENISDENISDENISDENISDENISDKNISDENISDENISDENISDENSSNENSSDENISDENISDENSSDENSSDENSSDENISDENSLNGNSSVNEETINSNTPAVPTHSDGLIDPALLEEISNSSGNVIQKIRDLYHSLTFWVHSQFMKHYSYSPQLVLFIAIGIPVVAVVTTVVVIYLLMCHKEEKMDIDAIKKDKQESRKRHGRSRSEAERESLLGRKESGRKSSRRSRGRSRGSSSADSTRHPLVTEDDDRNYYDAGMKNKLGPSSLSSRTSLKQVPSQGSMKKSASKASLHRVSSLGQIDLGDSLAPPSPYVPASPGPRPPSKVTRSRDSSLTRVSSLGKLAPNDDVQLHPVATPAPPRPSVVTPTPPRPPIPDKTTPKLPPLSTPEPQIYDQIQGPPRRVSMAPQAPALPPLEPAQPMYDQLPAGFRRVSLVQPSTPFPPVPTPQAPIYDQLPEGVRRVSLGPLTSMGSAMPSPQPIYDQSPAQARRFSVGPLTPGEAIYDNNVGLLSQENQNPVPSPFSPGLAYTPQQPGTPQGPYPSTPPRVSPIKRLSLGGPSLYQEGTPVAQPPQQQQQQHYEPRLSIGSYSALAPIAQSSQEQQEQQQQQQQQYEPRLSIGSYSALAPIAQSPQEQQQQQQQEQEQQQQPSFSTIPHPPPPPPLP